MQLYLEDKLNQDCQENLSNFNIEIKNFQKKEQILIVDDTQANLKVISDFLRESGFEVRAAKSGLQALKTLEKAVPDLILLDVMMPEMDGFETCRHLKAWEKTKDIPVIFMTAIADSSNSATKVQGLALGAVDYISKPIQLEEVLARVKTHLRLRSLTKQLSEQNTRLLLEIEVRQKTEEQLRLLERAIAASNNGILISDPHQPDNPIIYANSGFERITGYKQEEIIGKNCRLLQGEDTNQPELDELRHAIAQARETQVVLRNYRKDGTLFWNEFCLTPVRDATGDLRNFIGIQTDITERKQQEEAIRFLLSTTQAIAQAEDFNAAISLMLRSCCEFIHWDLAEAWIPNADGTLLECFPTECMSNLNGCSRCASDPGLEEFRHQSFSVTFAPSVGLPGRIWSSKQPQWIEDISVLPSQLFGRHQSASAVGLKAAFGVPIIVNDQVLAILVFFKRAAIPAQPHLLELVQSVATQVASLIQRKQIEEQLRKSEERWQLALKGNNEGIFDWNIKTGKIFTSARYKQILGYEDRELQLDFDGWKSSVHPDDFDLVMDTIQNYLERKTPYYAVEYRLQGKDGTYQWVLSRGQAQWDEAGKPVRMVGSTKDITERKLADEKLRASEAREREKATQLELTLNELKRTQAQLIQAERMSSLGRMVAGVAHEINNPVSFIYGNLTPAQQYFQDLLQLLTLYQKTYPNPTPEIRQLAEAIDLDFVIEDWPNLITSIEVGAERIQKIVLSLRSFSRLDESELKPVDIQGSIDNTLGILQPRLRAQGNYKEIQVIKDYSQLPLVTCYASQLNQVFMHLLSNAIDALESQPEPRMITISTSTLTKESPSPLISSRGTEIPNSQFAVIRIADNGPGMSEEVRQQMFDPFFTTKPVGSGTGLGLAISHQIVVEKHKGQISCVSAPGQGTELIVEIPVNLTTVS